MNAHQKIEAVPLEPVEVPAELRAVDCNTPEQWAEWARQRLEYEDPYGYGRRSRRLAPIVANPGVR